MRTNSTSGGDIPRIKVRRVQEDVSSFIVSPVFTAGSRPPQHEREIKISPALVFTRIPQNHHQAIGLALVLTRTPEKSSPCVA